MADRWLGPEGYVIKWVGMFGTLKVYRPDPCCRCWRRTLLDSGFCTTEAGRLNHDIHRPEDKDRTWMRSVKAQCVMWPRHASNLMQVWAIPSPLSQCEHRFSHARQTGEQACGTDWKKMGLWLEAEPQSPVKSSDRRKPWQTLSTLATPHTTYPTT